MVILITVLIIFGLLLINEFWWRLNKVHNEVSRKFVHITVGSFVAFWPYWLSWQDIRWFSLAFLVVVGLSKYFHIFRSIHSVQRPTWGELYFALAVGLLTFATNRPAIYAAALLQVSLADGFAALIGTRYGKANDYKVFGTVKSLAGSGSFMLVSYIIILSYALFSTPIPIAGCLTIAVIATGLENIAVRGLDNLVLPLFVALVLRLAA